MNQTLRFIFAIIGLGVLCYLLLKPSNFKRSLDYNDLKNSPQQLAYDKKTATQHKVLDSLANAYMNNYVFACGVQGSNDYVTDGLVYKNLITREVIDTVKVGGVAFQIAENKFDSNYNYDYIKIQTRNGKIGYIDRLFIREFEDILKARDLETAERTY